MWTPRLLAASQHSLFRSIKIGPRRLCVFLLPLCVIDRDILAPVELFYCFMETVRGPRAACADDLVIMTPLMHLTTLHICSGIPSICLMGQQGAAGQSSLARCACMCVFECLFFCFSYLHCSAFNRCYFALRPACVMVVTLKSYLFSVFRLCVCTRNKLTRVSVHALQLWMRQPLGHYGV